MRGPKSHDVEFFPKFSRTRAPGPRADRDRDLAEITAHVQPDRSADRPAHDNLLASTNRGEPVVHLRAPWRPCHFTARGLELSRHYRPGARAASRGRCSQKGVGVVSATAQRTFEAYRDATERRDADAVLQLFTDDAVLVEYDKEHPPSRPEERQGKGKIEEMLRDIYGRDMTHKVEGQVIGEDRFSFIERCEYPDGNRVIASGLCELREGQIQRETMLQAWDG